MNDFKLFRFAGIQVWLSPLWFLVLFYFVSAGKGPYSSQAWNVAECFALFGIVVMHEFGHCFAARQVGGKADRIVLWPLGGVAYAQPPPRPGALLWCIAAGPLVNVVLLPVTFALVYLGSNFGWAESQRDLMIFLSSLFGINLLLLKFNLLPIYPLDGGQIFQAILWFFVGRSRSIRIAAIIGLIGGCLMIVWALTKMDLWLAAIMVFLMQKSWLSLKYSRSLALWEKIPRHDEYACPECLEPPVAGEKWACTCGASYDPFVTQAICPQCHTLNHPVPCPMCRQLSPFSYWLPSHKQ